MFIMLSIPFFFLPLFLLPPALIFPFLLVMPAVIFHLLLPLMTGLEAAPAIVIVLTEIDTILPVTV
jgi:hypothetical protein